MNAVVLGSGGREHAIAWKLSKSEAIEKIYVIPGNGGTCSESKCENVSIPLSDIEELSRFLIEKETDFVVVGPEDPLAGGIADWLWSREIPVVGPKKAGAQLEASKDLSKGFMKKYGVACAKSETFTNLDKALDYIKRNPGPIVIKADGLAAGKGVVVAPDSAEAEKAVRSFMRDGLLGNAGKKVVIEEYLEGTECSILAAVSVTKDFTESGKSTIVPFVPARDHKRLLDGAKGPNTGGMGAFAPADGITEETMEQFESDILKPTLEGLKKEGFDYRGFIFFGLMVTKSGPKLLEYNVRLGDPETQAVLPLMDFDFAEMCQSILDGSLSEFPVKWKKGFVCAPVAVSKGYPGEYEKGKPIKIDSKIISENNCQVFIAGGKIEQGVLKTSGGRVLAVSAFGSSLKEARHAAYKGMQGISFDGMFFRKDISMPGAADSKAF